jgi:hypothetical protein
MKKKTKREKQFDELAARIEMKARWLEALKNAEPYRWVIDGIIYRLDVIE